MRAIAQRQAAHVGSGSLRHHAALRSTRQRDVSLHATILQAPFEESFVKAVSGEWEGACATFNAADGRVIPLPERYVPSAFGEWGVIVQDWQTVTTTLVTPSAAAGGTPGGSSNGSVRSSTIQSVTRRMMPTVGCEADAIAYVEEGEAPRSAANYKKQTCCSEDGSYFQGPQQLPAGGLPLLTCQVEVCLAVEPDKKQKAQRLRLMAHLEKGPQDGWRAVKYDLHQERYDRPYHGTLELCGCGGGMTAFSTFDRLPAQRVGSSAWQPAAAGGVVYQPSGPDGAMQLDTSATERPVPPVDAGASSLTLLPLGVFACFTAADQQQGFRLSVGAELASGAARKVGTVAYGSTGALELVALGSEALRS